MTTSRFLTEAGTPIGVYLPTIIPGVGPSEAGEWARRAEARGIDVVAVTNEGADDPAQPLRVVTRVVRDTVRATIFSDITVGWAWDPDEHAEHVAFVDALTSGRHVTSLTVPTGGVDSHRPEARFARMRRARRALPPSRLPMRLVLGGPAEDHADAIAGHAEGWFQRAGTPEAFAAGVSRVRAAWTAAGRPGRPQFVAAFHFALGDAALAAAERQHARIASLRGDAVAAAVITAGASTEEQIGDRAAAFTSAGADLVLGVPSVSDLDQLDRFAAAALPAVAPTLLGSVR